MDKNVADRNNYFVRNTPIERIVKVRAEEKVNPTNNQRRRNTATLSCLLLDLRVLGER